MTADNLNQPSLLAKSYPLYSSGQYLQSTVLLLFRLAFGLQMYLSGYRHLHNVDDMVSNFQDWGVPFPKFNVYVSGITEVFGGLLLMVGLATRLISIPLVFNFLVAILTAGKMRVQQALLGGDNFKRYNAGHLGGLEAVFDDAAFPFFLASLLTLSFGAGKASLDYLIHHLLFPPRDLQAAASSVNPTQQQGRSAR